MKIKKFSTPLWYVIFYVVFGIMLNIVGNKLAEWLSLPFWLDTLGTCLSACALGPVFGGLTGFASNLLLGVSNHVNVAYCVINLFIGVLIGHANRRGWMNELFGVLCMGFGVGIFSAACGTIITVAVYDGVTSNIWGSALFDMLSRYQLSVPFRSALAQLFIDIPDKIVSLIAVFGMVRLLKHCGSLAIDTDKR